MARAIEERKERFYKIFLEKANKIYSSWGAKGITSKQLVAKANQYALDKRLKKDAEYRFHVFAFTIALGIRLEKRYATFLRRLFRLFAYCRERNAFKLLKRVLGFYGHTDIREMLKMEVERMVVRLSHQKNRRSTGGGKRLGTSDIIIEEELNSLFEEYLREEKQQAVEDNLDTEELEEMEVQDEKNSVDTEGEHREKISVDELGGGERVGEQKQKANDSAKTEQTEKRTIKTFKTESVENKPIEKPLEKTVASTSNVADIAFLAQDGREESPSPFPVFRETVGNKTDARGNEPFAFNKENVGMTQARENVENRNKDIQTETDRSKNPFPVFKGEKTGDVKAPEGEIKPIKESKVIDERANLKDLEYYAQLENERQKVLYPQPEISEENKARIALNVTMSKMEILALTQQIKDAANVVLKQEEQEWREKISVSGGENDPKLNVQEPTTSSNKGAIVPGAKK